MDKGGEDGDEGRQGVNISRDEEVIQVNFQGY